PARGQAHAAGGRRGRTRRAAGSARGAPGDPGRRRRPRPGRGGRRPGARAAHRPGRRAGGRAAHRRAHRVRARRALGRRRRRAGRVPARRAGGVGDPAPQLRRVPGRTDHVVVVGAGLAGLSAALHLLGAGRRVTVLERADHPGGRAGRLDLRSERGTYRVDPGPTVLTMPELVGEALSAVGERLEDRLDLVQLRPAYRARFADGSTIDVHTDPEAMAEEVRATCGPAAAAGYQRLRSWLTRLYEVEIDRFIGANHDSPLGLLGPDLARLAALGGFGRLGPRVARMLPDERQQRIFTFQPLNAGAPPRRALGS